MAVNSGFDFFKATGSAYRDVWDRRAVIARHAMIPLMVKLGAFAAIVFFGLHDNFLRQGLVLLPSYLAEGFLAAIVIRMLVDREDLSIDMNAKTIPHARDLVASMIVYALIKVVLSAVVGIALLNGMGTQGASTAEPNLGRLLFSLGGIAFMIWAFRFVWLYVPVALGYNLDAYWQRIVPFKSSFPMIACWMMCFMPFGFVMLMMSQFIIGLFPTPEGVPPGQGARLLVMSVQAVIELSATLVSSAAMAYGVVEIMNRKADKE